MLTDYFACHEFDGFRHLQSEITARLVYLFRTAVGMHVDEPADRVVSQDTTTKQDHFISASQLHYLIRSVIGFVESGPRRVEGWAEYGCLICPDVAVLKNMAAPSKVGVFLAYIDL